MADPTAARPAELRSVVTLHAEHRGGVIDAYRRLEWHLTALLLAIDKGHGGAAALEQLHLLMWALRFPGGRATFLAWWHGIKETGPLASARFDPFLDRVLILAVADGLVARTAERWTLTTSGKDLVDRVKADDSLLASEKDFLKEIGGKVSRAAIERRLPG